MKAEFVEEKVDRDVIVTMKESEARAIKLFIGGTSRAGRRSLSSEQFDDAAVADLYDAVIAII